jgi:alpha-L-rhamnosidase
VLALRFDLLPKNLQAKAEEYLLADIEKRKGLLSTGFVGTGILAPTLSQFGHHEAAYKLLLNDEFPSWGYTIKHGATTIWERWDGWTDTKGFQDPGMNSFNHYAFGAIGEWMYSRVAGIDLDPDVPAYKRFLIQPEIGGGLTWVRASLDSVYGKIESRWKVSSGKLVLEVTVPSNVEAIVVVPTSDPSAIREGGKPVVKGAANGEPNLFEEGPGWAKFRVGGGTYRFEAPFRNP